MVTAVVIPIICLYFYWLSRRELQEVDRKWHALETIPEEAVVAGSIVDIHQYKERFYYHRFVHVLSLKIRTDQDTVTVNKITPLRRNIQIPDLRVGEAVRLYGNWKEESFRISRIEKQVVKENNKKEQES